MNHLILTAYTQIQRFVAVQDGQDLVEYALVVALVAFGAVTAMQGLSSELNTVFTTISSSLGSAL
jgi:pilus assembly protein Flp/PilA